MWVMLPPLPHQHMRAHAIGEPFSNDGASVDVAEHGGLVTSELNPRAASMVTEPVSLRRMRMSCIA